MLAGDGLYLRTGEFVVRLQSRIASVRHGVALMYAQHPLADPAGLADFHLRLVRPCSVRRWLRPQVQLLYDGQAPFKPLPLAQAYPMLEWGMNWCISQHAHGYLVLHAAVLERAGNAVILPAPAGAGKSTLCATLAYNGWRLLSDELALLRLADGLLAPLARPISLKNGSIGLLAAMLPATLFTTSVDATSKGTVAHLRAPADSVARQAEPAHPAWIIFPRYSEGAATSLRPMGKARAHMRVASNAFNYALLGAAGFNALAGLVERSDCYDFEYSRLDDAIDLFDTLAPPS
jgi:HprK-related kinase A